MASLEITWVAVQCIDARLPGVSFARSKLDLLDRVSAAFQAGGHGAKVICTLRMRLIRSDTAARSSGIVVSLIAGPVVALIAIGSLLLVGLSIFRINK